MGWAVPSGAKTRGRLRLTAKSGVASSCYERNPYSTPVAGSRFPPLSLYRRSPYSTPVPHTRFPVPAVAVGHAVASAQQATLHLRKPSRACCSCRKARVFCSHGFSTRGKGGSPPLFSLCLSPFEGRLSGVQTPRWGLEKEKGSGGAAVHGLETRGYRTVAPRGAEGKAPAAAAVCRRGSQAPRTAWGLYFAPGESPGVK